MVDLRRAQSSRFASFGSLVVVVFCEVLACVVLQHGQKECCGGKASVNVV